MNLRIRGVSAFQREVLNDGWEFCAMEADRFSDPASLSTATVQWARASSLGSVADILRSSAQWQLDGPSRRFDQDDWWFRIHFQIDQKQTHEEIFMGFDGLATLAEAWLNGQRLLESDNMFVAHEIRVDSFLRADNELIICFRSLDKALSKHRLRPRWRTPMVEQQQLRWFRTTLFGRTPGWSPPAAVVGPWRDVWIERRAVVRLDSLQISTRVLDNEAAVDIRCCASAVVTNVQQVKAILERKGTTYQLALSENAHGAYVGSLVVSNPDLWWPHTHGDPALYKLSLHVHCENTTRAVVVDLGNIGFRTVSLHSENGNFRISVNGVEIFCRGACWMPPDPISLRASTNTYDAALAQACAAGMNMIRVSGTTFYESREFMDACDKHGMLIWQDFMFASMDYPAEDRHFLESVKTEARQQLESWCGSPSLTVLCGNSEVEQQAAMWGAPKSAWEPYLFHKTLRDIASDLRPDVPYWPSSAHGGAFPHQANVGTTSYYGVSAYLRPLTDARNAEVRFATECLAFANVPEASTLEKIPGGLSLKVHHPQWKAGVPRDLGAGWDFEDIRDHYLAQLFDVNPLQLRYSDHDRYLDLSRVVSGEVMAATFAEWRRDASVCGGGLIWSLRDLRPGAGWGVIDAFGKPKAAWYFLRRALQPILVLLTDEGINGLVLHFVNETASTLHGTLELKMYSPTGALNFSGTKKISVQSRTKEHLSATDFFDSFIDLSYAYRFGPPSYEIAVATLHAENGTRLSEAFHFPAGLSAALRPPTGLTAIASRIDGDAFTLTISSQQFSQWVHVEVNGFDVDDQYFHIPPGENRTTILRRSSATQSLPRGLIRALNSAGSTRIKVLE